MPNFTFVLSATSAEVTITFEAKDEETAIVHARHYAGIQMNAEEWKSRKETTLLSEDVNVSGIDRIYRVVADGEPESGYADGVDFSE